MGLVRYLFLEVLVVGSSALLAAFAYMVSDQAHPFSKVWGFVFAVLQVKVVLVVGLRLYADQRQRRRWRHRP
jgi:hypothetical protein